jgi:hypothetical protein
VANLAEAVAEAPSGVRAPLYVKLGAEQDRLAALRAGLARIDGAPAELDPRRTAGRMQKRARELRAMLAKGGRDAAEAIRVVLGNTRLRADLVTVDGKRGWKLGGRIGGFYVLDAHHGSDTNLKKSVKGNVTATLVVTPAAAPTPAPAEAPVAQPAPAAPAATPAPAMATPPKA